MASLLDDDLTSVHHIMSNADDDLAIQELVMDDLHIVDMLAGHNEVVNEVTVLGAYVFEDAAVSSAEPEIPLCAESFEI